MIKIVWFIHRPERDIEGFERWYQDEHVPIGMRQEYLQRFRINRSFYPQPRFVAEATGSEEPRAYRFSEGYWQTVDDARRCYASPNGRAALADGPLNIGTLVPATPRVTLIVEEQAFPTREGLSFDIREGRYRAPLACKLFGFVRLRKGEEDAFDTGYAALAGKAAEDADLRGHVLGRTLAETIRLGRVAQIPPVGAEQFDRTLEYYFESPEALDRFCGGELMRKIVAFVGEFAEAVVWDAAQSQEVFFTSKGDQPLEESWKAFYS